MSKKIDNATQRRATGTLLALGILFALATTGCGNSGSSPSAARTTAYGSAATPKAQLFSVPQNQLGHLQVAPVTQATMARVLRLPGSVTYNAFETTPVITQVGGPVTRVLVEPGQFVRTGQPLCDVSSPNFSRLRASYLKARDSYTLAQEDYARAKDLYAHHAVAQMDLLNAQSARNQALANLQAAKQSLAVLGVDKPDSLTQPSASPEIPVLAPVSGEVVERLVAPGQVVQAGSTLVFTISNMSTVWVLVNVFQQNLGEIHLGEPVTIETDAYPEKFHGRISYIAPALDPTTRTLQVRVVTDNPGLKLKKGMYVTATVEAGKVTGLAIPDDAVLRNSVNEPFVYVETGSDQFAQRLVTPGASQNGQTEILSGLREGDRVVGNGSLFLQFALSRE